MANTGETTPSEDVAPFHIDVLWGTGKSGWLPEQVVFGTEDGDDDL